jgi:hypothetical protein
MATDSSVNELVQRTEESRFAKQEQFELARIEDAVRDLKSGRMIVVIDDEDRENEGDLAMTADMIAPSLRRCSNEHGSRSGSRLPKRGPKSSDRGGPTRQLALEERLRVKQCVGRCGNRHDLIEKTARLLDPDPGTEVLRQRAQTAQPVTLLCHQPDRVLP